MGSGREVSGLYKACAQAHNASPVYRSEFWGAEVVRLV